MGEAIASGIVLRGKQRRAVYDALSEPRCVKDVLLLARQTAPRITYQDARHILRNLERKRLVRCLNPDALTGRVYCQRHISQNIPTKDMALISAVLRAKARRAVFVVLALYVPFGRTTLSATEIKKLLRQFHPLTLNNTLVALEWLVSHRLLKTERSDGKRTPQLYSLSANGQRIAPMVTASAARHSFLAHPQKPGLITVELRPTKPRKSAVSNVFNDIN